MALNTALSDTDADSYVTLDEADAFFAAHYLLAKTTLWESFDDSQKEALLRRGVQVLETLPLEDNAVSRLYWNQALSFPRTDSFDGDGGYEIPQVVKDAQCEQAIYLPVVDEASMAAQMTGVMSESVSGGVGISTTFRGTPSLVAPMTYQLLLPLLRKGRKVRRG